jgi:hypothetical protein
VAWPPGLNALRMPESAVRSCSGAASGVFCNVDFSADVLGRGATGLATGWATTCSAPNQCLPATNNCQQVVNFDSGSHCNLAFSARVRLLPFSDTDSVNVGRDRNNCPTLARLQILSNTASENPCMVNTIIYATIGGLAALPGYFGTNSYLDTVQPSNTCPACAPGNKCSDGSQGVGCCYGSESKPCQCSPGKTDVDCSRPCNTGILHCNLQNDCRVESGTRVDARNTIVPWTTHDCLCAPGYFGMHCEITCKTACQHDGQCVVVGAGHPTCLCLPDFGGAACETSLLSCRAPPAPFGAASALCAGHGICRAAGGLRAPATP